MARLEVGLGAPLPATKSTNHHFHPHGAGLALFGLNEEEEDDVTLEEHTPSEDKA